MFRSSSTLLIVLVSTLVTTITAAGECANVTLTFCDNVQWQVNEEKRARADNIESMIQMSYYNQPGKWACKNEFKDLQCRVMFPQCSDMGGVGTNKAPCRTQCVDFLARCPGADIGCNDLSDDPKQCYNYNYDAGSVTGSTTSTYSKRRRSNVAVIIVRIVFISSILFYCLLSNHSFSTNPNKITNCFQLILFYLQLYKLHLLNAFVYF